MFLRSSSCGWPFFFTATRSFIRRTYIYKGFYKELEPIAQADIQRDDTTKNVLILGGSVVSSPWSHLEARLDSILQKTYPGGGKFAVYNAALAGHTSLDNRIKYDLLDRQRFDLVLYYEAINETRANNIPPDKFRTDYLAFSSGTATSTYYRRIPKSILPSFPSCCIKSTELRRMRFTHREYISQEKVVGDYVQYGQDIKTAVSFEKNLSDIIRTAKQRGDKLVLMTYATYFPPGVQLTGEQSDMDHFAGCYFASPVTIWGKPEYVAKGIAAHNEVTRQLAIRQQVTPHADGRADAAGLLTLLRCLPPQ